MKLSDALLLFLLAALWGASFLFIRLAAPVLGPFVLVDGRVMLAAAILILYAIARRDLPRLRDRWKDFLFLGIINAVIPFTLISFAELHLTASLAAILNATTPLFTTIIATVLLHDALPLKRILGLLLGLLGVAVLVGWSPLHIDGPVLLSIAASLLAALSYACGGIYTARSFKGTPPLALAIGQQCAAGIVLLPLALFHPPAQTPPTSVILACIALAFFATALAYLIYFRLINNVGATKTLTVTILVPVFGLLWGALFLQETITLGTLIGLVIVLASVVLVTGISLPLRLPRHRLIKTLGNRAHG